VIVHASDGREDDDALGLALAPSDAVLMIQFIKENGKRARKRPKPSAAFFEITMGGLPGRGHTTSGSREGWEFMTAKVAGGGYRMLIWTRSLRSLVRIPSVDEVLRFLRETRGLRCLTGATPRPRSSRRPIS
jgi:hypothetical protein